MSGGSPGSIGGSTPDRPVRRGVDDRRRLRAELAEYSTAADLNDLRAVLDRYDDVETDEIRALLPGPARPRRPAPHLRGPLGSTG